MTLSKETIERLRKDVKCAEYAGYDMDERSWGMEEGCVISYNEAKAILASVKGEEWVRVEDFDYETYEDVIGGHNIDGWVAAIYYANGNWYNCFDQAQSHPCYPSHIKSLPTPPKTK